MHKIKKSFFTLVEVMVSMGVFALLMLALMQFFSAAQGVWERTGRKAETFDSARIAMDILADDLACAYYELDHSSDYRYFDISTGDKTAVVFATQKPDGNAQVYYKWDSSSEYGKLYRLEEKEEDVSFSGGVPSKPWFTMSGNTAWITNIKTAFSNDSDKDKYLLADNVLDFEITAHTRTDLTNPINIPDTSGTPPRTFPDVVRVSMTLLSPDAIEIVI